MTDYTDITLIEMAWRNAMLSYEELLVADKGGNVLHHVVGTSIRIILPDNVRSILRDKIVSHYHPSIATARLHREKCDNPLSYTDMATAFQHFVYEVRAVCDNYIYSFKPKVPLTPYSLHETIVRNNFTEWDDDLQWEETLIGLAALTGSCYEKIPIGGEQNGNN